jgi:hypothetical protein
MSDVIRKVDAEEALALAQKAVGGAWSYAPRMSAARGWNISTSTFADESDPSAAVFAVVEGDGDQEIEEQLLATTKFIVNARFLVISLAKEVVALREQLAQKNVVKEVASPVKPVEQKRSYQFRSPNSILKPCPVTGVPNKHRRFSYLMPEARTPENLIKYRMSGGESKEAKRVLGSAAAAKRTPTAVPPIVRRAASN